MVNVPDKSRERKYYAEGYDAVIGVDEVGMGCLAGPVVVCATLIDASFFRRRQRALEGVRDSKQLTALGRERFAAQLGRHPSVRQVVVTVSAHDVDTYNVLQAARRGMKAAITRLIKLAESKNPIILVDGNREIPSLRWQQETIIGGDRRVFSISCASIVAKVYRDAWMSRLAVRYPAYGFEVHKGYGTKFHRAKIRELGPTPQHRRTFAGVDLTTQSE